MTEITPAILEKNFSEIKNKLSILRRFIKCVHLDIEDGIFTNQPAWPFASGGFEDADFQKIVNFL